MTPVSDANFKQNYQTHLKHLKLKGLQPKTIEVSWSTESFGSPSGP